MAYVGVKPAGITNAAQVTVTGDATVNGAFTSPGIDDNADATAITIDSSENVMIGTTDTVPSNNGASGDAGVAISPDGVFRAARSGNVSLDINRMDSHGEIAAFRKDGTTVGSIGIQSSGFYIDGESGHEGIRFANGSITPRENGSDSDGTSDLGASNNRFKDLYLGGNLYIGGTGSSNALDDYETGSYQPTVDQGISGVSYSAQVGRYTKVGRVVYFLQHIDVASHSSRTGGQLQLGGLPFTALNTSNVWGSAWWVYTGGGYNLDTTHITWAIQGGTTRIIAYKNSGAVFTGSNISDANAGFHLAGFYYV